MSKGDTSVILTDDTLTPRFQHSAPLPDMLSRPLSAEEKQELNDLMTQTPEYQSLMGMCQDLKTGMVESGAEVIAIIELIKSGDINKDDPETYEAAINVLQAAAEAFDKGKEALTQINGDLKSSELPLGKCAMKGDQPHTPEPAPLPAP